MSIKKSQAILKRFTGLKFSVWFTLGSENETTFCYTWNFPLSSFSFLRFLIPLSFCSFPTYLGKIEATLLSILSSSKNFGDLSYLLRFPVPKS